MAASQANKGIKTLLECEGLTEGQLRGELCRGRCRALCLFACRVFAFLRIPLKAPTLQRLEGSCVSISSLVRPEKHLVA